MNRAPSSNPSRRCPPAPGGGPSMRFRAGRFRYDFPRPLLVMGIVNVTPDSFADGGRYFSSGAAVEHALELVNAGAEIIDVGGESTRPNAQPVEAAEECRRVLPVIEQLAGRIPVPISIDTRKVEVAEAALRAGASLVNDIGAHRGDDGLWRLVAAHGAGYVCMHMQGTPQTMQQHPCYVDVVAEVEGFFADRLAALRQAGVAADQVILDVGIGFGKNDEHNLQLLGALRHFTKLGRPLLLGVSRKSFIGRLLKAEVDARLPGSLACSCWAAEAGVQAVRVHDVAETVQAVRMWELLRAHQRT